MDKIEKIFWKKKLFAYIVRNQKPQKTVFITPRESNLQVGFVVYQENNEIPRHVHNPIRRILDRTEEVLIVRQGRARLDIYDDEKKRVDSKEVFEGDVIILVNGGHGFHIYEDTVLLEIKQGPYTGISEKKRF
ncbi:hypothetical protein A3D77_07400 [Candidatus Gottesmanbacteria bacterium RIFCSPHIGHO2_02_FULL_39_11]|uniref:Cupin 2 conserved barrel domain-containing protein n=1 Tax=Candidatus Gottesmanbacteria bacterium RIFCSPHIGHO2_02_FULL_39_11 TaxID=1798382 RepID=A0A1F5ZKK6_9BACT|nr:MAG: hypothetical protein A3D77_07400 [Candidatus Gottesmanbacteria bacterium RIFCSPHIGHO2_02_FULL_39_11]